MRGIICLASLEIVETDPFQLGEKVVVVSGGASGVGPAVANILR